MERLDQVIVEVPNQAILMSLGRNGSLQPDHTAVPQVIFTDPQIASVGFTEKGAHSLNMNVRAVD